MTDSKAIELYERELRLAWGCTESTIKRYLIHIENLRKALSEINCNLLTATRDDFLSWRESILDLAPNGQRSAVSAAKSFYGFLRDANHIQENVFPNIKIRMKQQEATDVPTVEQFLQIRTNVGKPLKDPRVIPVEVRRLIVEILAGSGLRIDALLTLCPKHLRLTERPHILVEHSSMACKGKVAGEIPISAYCARLLGNYIERHKPPVDQPILNVSASLIRKVLRQVQPEGLSLHPHSLRHFYCSMCYFRNFDGGKNDILWVRDAAGHGSIMTTNIYLKMARRVCQNEMLWQTWAEGKPVNQQEAISA